MAFRPNSATDSDAMMEKSDDEHSRDDDQATEDNTEDSTEPGERTATDAPDGKDEAFRVSFEKGDPDDPHNWSGFYKAKITALLGFLALAGSIGSSIISPGSDEIVEEFNISQEVAVLTVSLYVLGFALGPMMWAPISEVYGRKWSMLPALVGLGLFSIGSALSPNAQSLFITRFFAGLFGSAPISNVTAALGDMYAPRARGIAVTFYAVMVVGGPTLGPVIGSAIINNPSLGWRWTEWVESIFVGVIVSVAFFTLPEIYGPCLLKRKARQMRKTSGDDRYWHPQESERIRLNNIITKYFARPLRMLVTEPMVACIASYASFVYGILYLFIQVVPIVFREQRGYGPVVSTLPFLGLFVGVCLAVGINLGNQAQYGKAMAKNGGRAVPEARLPPVVIGGVLFSAGLFWFGWTAAPRYHWSLPTVALGFVGAGFNTIFQQCLNYLVDTYGPYAASSTASNTFLRSILGCALPLAARPMFLNLGIGPAASILGGVSCLGLPVPFLFMKYGERLRQKSNFAPV
ncbi:bicyclomycin resistance protein [Zymoseptoria brevis]|uniref:Cercosporin MFS transporter CTB4 n=1 Tax=Zymoseptoria brevis TaxID=1047168 RepID=A0A0F4GZF8_9PEZI|nr:bicyclomycin resistance protein [Zymoseptoria brevis]